MSPALPVVSGAQVAVAPLVLTAVYRASDAVATLAPIVVVFALAMWLGATKPRHRPVAVGLGAGAVAHFVFLLYVLSSFGAPDF